MATIVNSNSPIGRSRRPFQVAVKTLHGERCLVIDVICHGMRLGSKCVLFDSEPGSLVTPASRLSSRLRVMLTGIRRELRSLQPRRHRIAHLSCYPKERVDEIMEARMVCERALAEARHRGGTLGTAIIHPGFTIPRLHLMLLELLPRAGGRPSDAATLAAAKAIVEHQASLALGG